MKAVTIVLAISICFAAAFGDFIVFKSRYSDSQVFTALADNSVHAALGFLSALQFFSLGVNISTEACIYNIIFCTAVSSLIDVDHVILAKSFYFRDLVNLRGRGFLHCTTLWLAYTLLLLIYSCMTRKLNLYVLSFMLILAFSSHHMRDGHQRGLWMFPFGHTPPINRNVYILGSAVMPVVFYYIFYYFNPHVKYNTVYSHVV
ncbi:transmembrane protein 267 [Aricia agestis]|uniref:transmembrane protein 267 n=1 Tax=Aricia agestis TaxID=91739 RepID=UPI001C201F60|nr:transmembrane protein 267 [Aricia agestis]